MTTGRDEIDIEAGDGIVHAWTCWSGEGSRPAVLLYPDAYGVRRAMLEMAERVAALGYFVLLPNVFYRAGDYPPFDKATVWTDPLERERLTALIRSLTPDRLSVDAGAYLDAIAAQQRARADRIGVTGYCMGGRLSFLTAALHPDRIRAAASFHGGGLVTDSPDSPHRLADRLKASVYLAVADDDRNCTPEHQGALAAALGVAKVHYCIELYPGKKHGFAVRDHPGAYDADAADRHWRRTEAFFAEALG